MPIALVGVGGNGLTFKVLFHLQSYQTQQRHVDYWQKQIFNKNLRFAKSRSGKRIRKNWQYEKIQLVSVAQYQLAYARLLELKSLYDEPSKY